MLTGGARAMHSGRLAGGYYVQPTILEGPQQDAGFPGGNLRAGGVGDHASRTPRSTHSSIANDTLYGLGAGVWTRDGNTQAYRIGSRHSGRPCVDQLLPRLSRRTRRSAATSRSGIGRENHKMMLDHYQQTKNLLVSYSPKALGFF